MRGEARRRTRVSSRRRSSYISEIVSVALDSPDRPISGSAGEYNWSGAASTHFWIDPAEDLAVIFMTQYLPGGPDTRYNLSRELRAIIYGALN